MTPLHTQRLGTVEAPPSRTATMLRGSSGSCRTCGGSEIYRLSRSVGADRVELELCRRCHAHLDLVVGIDRLTDEALAE